MLELKKLNDMEQVNGNDLKQGQIVIFSCISAFIDKN